jgi:hypothetical protein
LSEFCRPYGAVSVNYDREGQGASGIAEASCEIGTAESADEDRVIDGDFLQEVLNVLRRVDPDPNELNALGCIGIMQPNEFGHLCHARTAPRRPEVDDEHASLIWRKRFGLAVDILQGRRQQLRDGVGGGRSRFWRSSLRLTGRAAVFVADQPVSRADAKGRSDERNRHDGKCSFSFHLSK